MPRKPKPFVHQGYFVTTAGGKWRKLCPVGDGFDEAVRILELPDLPGGATLSQTIAQYSQHCQSYYVLPGGRVSSEPRNIALALSYLLRAAGDVPTAQLSKEHLKAARELMVKTCSRKTTNQHVGRVKRFARWAADKGLLPDAAALSIGSLSNLPAFRSGAVEHDPVEAVDWSHVEPVVGAIAEPWRSLVLLQWYSGLRPAEACGLLRSQLADTPAGRVVDLGLQHKGGWRNRRKVIPVGPRAVEVLSPWVEAAALHDRDAIFVTTWTASEKPRPAQPSSYAHAVLRACKRLKVPEWSPNQLRHAYATRVRAALGLEAAQHALGHAKADVTQVYAERDAKLARKAADELG
jgi:integrase